MGKAVGSSKLGELFDGDKKVFKHREWRGVKDTLSSSVLKLTDGALNRSNHSLISQAAYLKKFLS